MDIHFYVNAAHSSTTNLRDKIDEHVRQAELARDCGFSGLAVGQHLSLGELQWPPPLPFLAYLTARVPELALSLTAALATFFDPVLLAEQLAFLDVLCGGRLTIGLAPGWVEAEFAALGLNRHDRLDVFEHRLRIVDDLLSGSEVEIGGHPVRLGLRPIQQPRPPLLIGASSPRTARKLAQLADSMVLSAHIPLPRQVEIQRGFLSGRGSADDHPPTMLLLRNVFVAESREEALETALPYLSGAYAHFGDWGLFSQVLNEQDKRTLWREQLLDRAIVGDPDDVAKEIRRSAEALRTDTVVLCMQWRGMPSRHVERAIRLIGDQVLPLL